MSKQSFWLIRFLFLFFTINFNFCFALESTYSDSGKFPTKTSTGELFFDISGGCEETVSVNGKCPRIEYTSCDYVYTGYTYPNVSTGLCDVLLLSGNYPQWNGTSLDNIYPNLETIISSVRNSNFFKNFRFDISYEIDDLVSEGQVVIPNANVFLGADIYAVCDFGNGKPLVTTLLYQVHRNVPQSIFWSGCKQVDNTQSSSSRANGMSTPVDQAGDESVISQINLADTVSDAKALADNSPSCNAQTVSCHQCLDAATTIDAVKTCVCNQAKSNNGGPAAAHPACSAPITGGAKALDNAAKNDPTAKSDADAAAAADKALDDALSDYNKCADNDATCRDNALTKVKDLMSKARDAKDKAKASAAKAAGLNGSGSSGSGSGSGTGPNSQACKDSKDPTKQGSSSNSGGYSGFNSCNSYELAVDQCYRVDSSDIWSGTIAAYPDAKCVDVPNSSPPAGTREGLIRFFYNGTYRNDGAGNYPYSCPADAPAPKPRDPKTGKPTTPTTPTDPCAGGTGTGTGNGTGNGATSSDIKGLQDSINANGDKNSKAIVDALNKTGTAPTVTKQGLYTAKSSGQTFGTIWDSKKSSFDNSTFVQGLKKMTFIDPGGSCPTFDQLGAISLGGHNIFEGGDLSTYICPILLFFRAAFLFLSVMVARQILWG